MASHPALRALARGAVSLRAMAVMSLGGACAADTTDPWAQLNPESPCYEVDLRDGVGTADELRTAFDCFDRHGHLRSLHATVETLEADDRAGLSALVLAIAAAEGALGDQPLPGLPDLPDPALQDLLLEALSGAPGDGVGQVEPQGPPAAWAGAGPSVEVQLANLRDQPPAVAALATLGRHPSLEEAAVAWLRARDQPQGPFVAPLVHHVAAAAVAGDPEGHATSAWLDTWVVAPLGALPRSFFTLQLLTAEASWRQEVTAHVAAHEDLGEVPAAAAWLAKVDANGVPLGSGGPSALFQILTLLDRGTEPVTCTVGFEPLAIDLSFDDLTVRLLRIVAGMEPGTLGTASSVWSTLTDNRVADIALEAAVASGACPAFDDAAREGLDALDLLTADEVEPLLRLITPILDTTERHQALPHLADVFGTIGDPDALRDLDALVAAVGPTPDAADAARAVQGLASPVPGGAPALRHLLDGFAYALTGEPGVIGPPAVIAYPWLREVAADEALRTSVGRLATTWADERSHIRRLSDHLPEEAVVRDAFALLRPLLQPDVVEPLLDAAATPGAWTALLATEPEADGTLAPVVALTSAVREGTLADAFAWFEQASSQTQR